MKVTLRRFETLLQGELPVAQQTLYKWSSKKQVDWLGREDPSGHRGRELWADVHKYNAWAAPRGHRLITLEQGRAAN